MSKNAYEIRLDVLKMACEMVDKKYEMMFNSEKNETSRSFVAESYDKNSVDETIEMANKMYSSFIE